MKIKKGDNVDLSLVLVSLSIFVALIYSPVKPEKFGDGNFHIETKNWLNILFSDGDWSSFYIQKAPGPDIYYLIPYTLVGPDGDNDDYWLSGIIWNLLFMILAVLLVRRTATDLFGRKAGIISGMLLLIFPVHMYYAMGINGESMVFISFVLLLYGGTKWSQKAGMALKSKAWWCFFLGSVSLIMARLNFVVIIPLVILFLLVTVKRKNAYHLRVGLILYCILITMFSVFLRGLLNNLPGNKGHSFQDNYSAYVLHLGRFQFREEPWDWRLWHGGYRPDSHDYIHWRESMKSLTEIIVDEGRPSHQVYNEWAINDYVSHPFITLRQFLVKALYGHVFTINSIQPDNFSLGPLKGTSGYYIFHFLVNAINLLVIIGFLGFLWKYKNQLLSTYWLILILCLSFIGFYSLTYMEPRYLFPVRVLYIVTASHFWCALLNRQITQHLIKWGRNR